MYPVKSASQEPDLDRGPASPGLDPVEIVRSCHPPARRGHLLALRRSSHRGRHLTGSLDGPWSSRSRFVLGVGVGGSRDALVHGLVRAGSRVAGTRRPSDLAFAGSGSVAVPACCARGRKDGGNPGPLPGATPRSLTERRKRPGQSRARSATITARSRCCQRSAGTRWAAASHCSCSAAVLGRS